MNRQFENAAKMVDGRLRELMRVRTPELLWRSMEYSVSAGGKRLRPALNIMAAELMGGDPAETLDMAAAIEMIHTYSLIHDDLPALDNDELRRGRPTNHIVFGEAQAVLAGDGLLNYAYEVMLQNAMRYRDNLEAHMSAISIVARAAGVDGMIAGQVVDVESEGRVINKAKVDYIHSKKTGAMITGALLSGAELFAPTPEEKAAVKKYGEAIGLVFQIVDDVLDVTADAELGKTVGKDALQGKMTYASLFGVGGSMEIATEYTKEAEKALELFGDRAQPFIEVAEMLLNRKK